MKSIDGCSSVNAPDICDSNGARMDELGEADRIGERGTGAPSFPLAIAIANFSFPHTRCEEDEEGRRNVLTFYPCQPHSIVVRTSTPPPVNLPRPSTAALQHENREWGGIGGERKASISKNDDIFAF